MNLELEKIDVGRLGTLDFYQLQGQAFSDACKLTQDMTVGDHTGLRMHPGAPILSRFVAKYPELLNDRSVIELGCGIGLVSVTVLLTSNPSVFIATDGNLDAVDICDKNVKRLYKSESRSTRVKTYQLIWSARTAEECIKNEGIECFDVVLGSELMYYLTDLPALMACVQSLTGTKAGARSGDVTKSDGVENEKVESLSSSSSTPLPLSSSDRCPLFISAHVFRKDRQVDDFAALLHKAGWIAYEIPVESFIDETELRFNPGWYNARMLVAGAKAEVMRLAKTRDDWNDWKELQAKLVEEDAEAQNAEDFLQMIS